MRLIYGTGNPAKLEYMRGVLKGMDVELAGLAELSVPAPEVEETGSDPLENATLKAMAYYRAFGQPVFSCDSGLYIEGLDEALQPGVNVRTVRGRRLTDDEMIEYYAGLARSLGGRATAQYRNAICLVMGEGTVYRYFDDDIASERFLLADRPHARRMPGFPLDSLSVEIRSGQYYFDLNDFGHIDTEHTEERGFRGFFSRVLSDWQLLCYNSTGA